MANTDIHIRMAMQLEAMSRRLDTISSDLQLCPNLSIARNSFPKEIADIAKLQTAIADLLVSGEPEMACQDSNLHQIRLLSMPSFAKIQS